MVSESILEDNNCIKDDDYEIDQSSRQGDDDANLRNILYQSPQLIFMNISHQMGRLTHVIRTFIINHYIICRQMIFVVLKFS